MAEPLSTGVATLILTGAAVPVLTIAGISLGVRVDVLLAGFLGAVSAIGLLNTVPSSGDTWRELLRTTGRRVFVAACSAFVAGYLAPAFTPEAISLIGLLSTAFIFGAGAQKVLNTAIEKWSVKVEAKA